MGGKGLYRERKVGGNDLRPKKRIKEENPIMTGGKWVGRAYIGKGKWVGMTLGQRSG
jgi:hypothetical protein